MTRLLISALAVALFAPGLAHAQDGRVTYSVTTTLDIELPPEVAHLQNQMPSETTEQRILLFDASAALTQGPPSDDAVADPSDFQASDSGARIMFRRADSGSKSQTHVDLATGTVTETRDFLGRDFRIVGERPSFAWRLTGEQSEFLGYPCQKAIVQRDSTVIEAWFTPAIPASVGPETYGGLPGLILVLTDGVRTFEATEIDLSPLADGAIETPTGGQEVTRESFTEIVEERMRDLETTGLSTTSEGGRRSTFRVIRRGN